MNFEIVEAYVQTAEQLRGYLVCFQPPTDESGRQEPFDFMMAQLYQELYAITGAN